ncbi:MAG: 5'-3' exonuclease H3TH domain-containing protein [bacterium]|nr:5'-3' exonuclease H3TH domain-containing protein [bacterium]
MKTLFLIDANALIHRAFHALPPTFTAPDGRPTNALYGISSVLMKLLREDKPDYAAALFDRPEPTYRDKEYKEYKAHRPKAADELISQIIESRTLFEKFGIKAIEKPGAEADDLIATLAKKFGDDPELHVTILTGDMDALQLVREDKVIVRAFKKGLSDTITYNDVAVRERYGLGPKELIDYKALVGDPSDNLKGVTGIGPKSAKSLLSEYGSIERAAKEAPESSAANKLRECLEEARFFKRLVTLQDDLEVPVATIEDLSIQKNDEVLVGYFRSLGFRTLIERLLKGDSVAAAKPKKEPKAKKVKENPNQGSMW